MSARHTLALDAAVIAQILKRLKRLTPAVCAEIARIHTEIYHTFPVIEFWHMWLGNGWGSFSDGVEREAYDAAAAAWEALAWQRQDDALEYEVAGIDAVETPITPPLPHLAQIDDNALLLEMYELVTVGKLHPWTAAGQVAPRAQGDGNPNSKQRRLRAAYKARYGV